jgi:hypothetical protein
MAERLILQEQKSVTYIPVQTLLMRIQALAG